MARCNLCRTTEFTQIGRRLYCAKCKAGPRTRMLGLAVRRATPTPTDLPVIHIAPEAALVALMKRRYGDAWTPSDYLPERWDRPRNGRPVQFCDLSEPSRFYAPGSVQGFVHSHVLEHVPAPLDKVLPEMNAAVAPGGFHAFIVPGRFPPNYYEDLSPMSPDDRKAVFGHPEHMRLFGSDDWAETVLTHFKGWHQVRISDHVDLAELKQANIPGGEKTLDGLTGSTVHLFVKEAG